MAQPGRHPVLQFIRHLAGELEAANLSDRELLDLYVANRDDHAFRALVRRHGPMVLRVCQGVLGAGADADDAFQACFITLSRKAGSIVVNESVGGWLHKVARRLSLETRRSQDRRHAREARAMASSVPDPLTEITSREMFAVLDEELAKLPDRYRVPLVLSYLEGQSPDQIAQTLGCAPRTLQARLQKARELLRKRFAHRGFTLSATAIGALLLQSVASATVCPILTADTIRVALLAGAGSPLAGGVVSTGVALLIRETTGVVFWTKAKIILAMILTGIAIAGGGTVAWRGLPEMGKDDIHDSRSEILHPKSPNQLLRAQVERQPERPRFDDYGDSLPKGALGRIGTLRCRPGDGIRATAVMPDRPVVAAAAGNIISSWDATNGKLLARFSAGEEIWALAYSADGRMLASGDARGAVRLLDAVSGREIRQLADRGPYVRTYPGCNPGHGLIGLQFGPRDEWLIGWANDVTIRRWDTATGKELGRFDSMGSLPVALALSADGRRLAAGFCHGGCDKTVCTYDVRTGEELRYFRDFDQSVSHLAFLRDGKTLLGGLSSDGGNGSPGSASVIRWDVETGKVVGSLTAVGGSMCAFATSPDDKTFVTGGNDRVIRLWDLASGKEMRKMGPLDASVMRLVYSGDGKTVISSGWESCVRLWDTATGREVVSMDAAGSIHTLAAFSPAGNCIAASSGTTIRIYEVTSSSLVSPREGGRIHVREIHKLEDNQSTITAILFSRDGRFLISGNTGPTVRVWDMNSGRECRRFEPFRHSPTLALSPDGQTLAALNSRNISLLDFATAKELRQLVAYTEDVPAWWSLYSPSFSSDGRTFVANSPKHSTLFRWDLTTGWQQPSIDGNDGGVNASVLSPDGRTVAMATCGGSISLWEMATNQARWVVREAGDVSTLAISPDGRFLAVANCWFAGGRRDQYGNLLDEDWEKHTGIRLLDLEDGKVAHTFEGGHLGDVTALAFSPDGNVLASSSKDTTVLLWDVAAYAKEVSRPKSRARTTDLEEMWADLKGNAAQAHRSIVTLASEPAQVVPFLKSRLRPVSVTDGRRLTALIAQLDRGGFLERKQAMRTLREIADGAVPALREVLKGQPSAEVRRRIGELLEELDIAVLTGEPLRCERAVEVLERIGNNAARALLQELAGGAPEARLTREAQASLARLQGSRLGIRKK